MSFRLILTRPLLQTRLYPPPITRRRLLSSTAASSPARVAVVTGAARGIGRSIALRLAHDGFDVAINDLPESEEKLQDVSESIAAAGRQVFLCTGDVSVEADVQRLVNGTAQRLGSVDVMVANAGVASFGYLHDITTDEWDRVFGVNARGTFLCYKYAAMQMIKQGKGGRIIGASSIGGKQGASLGATYCSTKFAIRGLTQSAAQELAPHGITVNAYAPGLIETDMAALAIQVTNMDGGEALDIKKYTSPLGFNGQPEDIAGLVSYLASSNSRFVTGQSISIDGGIFFD